MHKTDVNKDGQAATSEYRFRIDRIFSYNEASRHFSMIPGETGHTESAMSRILGKYSSDEESSYKNSWVLLSSSPNLRYFGKSANKIPDASPGLLKDAKRMG